jgi:hypothetical protein
MGKIMSVLLKNGKAWFPRYIDSNKPDLQRRRANGGCAHCIYIHIYMLHICICLCICTRTNTSFNNIKRIYCVSPVIFSILSFPSPFQTQCFHIFISHRFRHCSQFSGFLIPGNTSHPTIRSLLPWPPFPAPGIFSATPSWLPLLQIPPPASQIRTLAEMVICKYMYVYA